MKSNPMKCPKCERVGCKYNQRPEDRKRSEGGSYVPGAKFHMKRRTDFTATCKGCGWIGILR